MLAKRIIPCLDVTGGRVVKGVNFVDLRDAGDPVECAKAYEAQGADELTFLDITASSDGRDTMVDIVRRCAEQVFMPLTVGGGIRTAADVRRMLNAGADKVSFNTAAIHNPDILNGRPTSCIVTTKEVHQVTLSPVRCRGRYRKYTAALKRAVNQGKTDILRHVKMKSMNTPCSWSKGCFERSRQSTTRNRVNGVLKQMVTVQYVLQ